MNVLDEVKPHKQSTMYGIKFQFQPARGRIVWTDANLKMLGTLKAEVDVAAAKVDDTVLRKESQ